MPGFFCPGWDAVKLLLESGRVICRSEFEEIQEAPFVGVKCNIDYLRSGNVTFNDQLLRLHYLEEG